MRQTKWFLKAVTLVLGAFCTQAAAQSVTWSRIAGPYAGQIQLLTVDQTGDAFATTFTGRVEIYRSTDRGGDWQHVFSVLSYGYEPALATDSLNNIYYGDIDAGLFESTDRGTSWFKTNLAGGASAIAVISGNRICVGGMQTVSISSDAGKTWTTSTVTEDPVEVLSIAEDDSGNIYAGFRAIPASPNNPGYGGGVYISSDSGRTWGFYGMPMTISSIAAEKEIGKVFILLGSRLIYSAALKSSNWRQDAEGIPYWVNSIESLFSDRNGHVGVVTNAGIYLYNDSTSRWSSVTPAISSDSITTAVYDPDGRSYAGTGNDGIYFLDNSRSTWVQCGINPASVASLGMDMDDNLYVGTDGGIFEQGFGSTQWLRVSDGLSRARVNQIRWSTLSNVLYASTEDGLYYLPPSGNYWIPLTGQWVYDFIETPTRYYAGTTGGIYVADNGLGAGWGALPTIGLPLTSIYCLALDSSGNLYAGTKHDGVFVSSGDRSFWWQVGVSSPIIFSSVKTLEIGYMGRMFAGTDSSGAYCSDDSGETWESISSISGRDVTCFLTGFPSRYFAGTYDRGVFLSTDRGLSWQPENAGLADSNVTALLLDKLGYIYVGTDNGLFKSDRVVTAIRENKPAASLFHLFQNYPNPFNPSTMINYQLPMASHVTLKIYDVLGREVRTLVNEVQKRGSYGVEFDGRKLSSGLYFYTLVAGSYVVTKKMVLIK